LSGQAVTPLLRRAVLPLALIASIAATLWTYRNEQQDVMDENVQLVHSNAPTGVVVSGTNLEVIATPARATINGPHRLKDQVVEEMAATPNSSIRNAAKVLLDPFAPLAVALPAPPKPVAVAVLAAPVAPTLPFQYMGRLEQSQKALPGKADSKNSVGTANGTKTVVYLARGDESFSVSAGENIDANYRFVGIEDDALVFIYLPLSLRQTLPVGP
jgi:hypothetical protein